MSVNDGILYQKVQQSEQVVENSDKMVMSGEKIGTESIS
jgi:hypothetical protein